MCLAFVKSVFRAYHRQLCRRILFALERVAETALYCDLANLVTHMVRCGHGQTFCQVVFPRLSVAALANDPDSSLRQMLNAMEMPELEKVISALLKYLPGQFGACSNVSIAIHPKSLR